MVGRLVLGALIFLAACVTSREKGGLPPVTRKERYVSCRNSHSLSVFVVSVSVSISVSLKRYLSSHEHTPTPTHLSRAPSVMGEL